MDNSNCQRGRLVVTTTVNHKNLHLLCPKGELRWGKWDISLNPPKGTVCDYWIVFAGSRDRDFMFCAPENTLFIAGEPPSKKIYPPSFYAQFYRIVSTHADDPHPRVVASALGLNWHVGLDRPNDEYVFGYDYLKSLPAPPKANKVSVVCSHLTTTAGQRLRLELLEHLKSNLGDKIVHFGYGFTPIKDKLDAILPYRYHLVLENSESPHYWTEKLADAYLGWAHPIYLGCNNVADYFPNKSFTPILAADFTGALAIVKAALQSSLEPDAFRILATSRDLILNKYNLFGRCAYWASEFYRQDAAAKKVKITTHKSYRPFPKGLVYQLRSAVGGILGNAPNP